MKKLLGLCVDCGTGSVRAQLFDWDSGEWLGSRQELGWTTYEDCAGRGEIVMFGESAARTVAHVLSRLIADIPKSLASADHELIGIAIGGHMHAPFVVERDGRVAVPVQMWNSDRAVRSAQRLSAELGWKIDRRLTASHIAEFVSGNETAFSPERVLKITTCSGYIAYLLCSKFGLGPCEGSGMGFSHPADARLSSEVMSAVADSHISTKDLSDMLPPILEPGSVLGKIDPHSPLGKLLPNQWRNAVLAAPEGDQAMGRLALCRGPKDISLVLGSSLVLITVAEVWGRREDPTHTVDFFSDPTGLPMSMGLLANGMRIADRFLEEFAEEHYGGKVSGRVFEDLAGRACARISEGDPFSGLHFPFREPALGVSAPFSSLSPEKDIARTWAQLLLQIASAIGIRARQLLAGGRPERIILGGAAARDDLLASLIATATGVEVLRPDGGAEAMMLGAQALIRASHASQVGGKPFAEVLAEYQPTQKGTLFAPDAERRSVVESFMQRMELELSQQAH